MPHDQRDARDARDERVLVLAPTGRDAPLAVSVLAQAGFHAEPCAGVGDLSAKIAEGVGAVLVAEEALTGEATARLAEVIQRQPPWSDLPLIVFSSPESTERAAQRTLERVGPLGYVTLLERPIRVITLVSAVRTALRARRRQYELRSLVARLERGVEERDQFLAMLGHELRNPLAATLYAVEILDRVGANDERSARQRGVIRRQTSHLSRMVDELLDVARVTSGRITLSRERLDFVELVERCVRSMEAAFTAQSLEVAFASNAGALVIDGDPTRMEQVVSNLLGNAVKYTPSGGHVRVDVTRDGDDVVLRVEDDGVGIAPEMLPRIFDLFTQVEGSLDRSRGGLGIGLTVVERLIRLHGGAVQVESGGLGRGSRFTVRLPLAEKSASAEPGAGVGGAEAMVASRSVLVIEDNADIRETLQFLLEEFGHRVDVAEDGPGGLERALATRPEVVLVDIGLPGLDGYGVARGIRSALGRQMHLIALTGYGQPEDKQRAIDAGFDTHLVKPITVEALVRVLDGAGAV